MSVFSNHSARTHISQLWKFIICGGMGFVCDMASMTYFVEQLSMDRRVAGVLSSFVGATFVFFANKFFTFRNRETAYKNQILKFAMVYGVSIVGNAGIYYFLVELGVQYHVSKIIAVGIGAVWNYALSHGFIFKKHEHVDVGVV